MSKRTRSWCWSLLGLGLVVVLLAPVLTSSRTLIYRDCLPYTLPLNHILRTSLSQGLIPEWDSTGYAGVPFLANPSSQALYLPRWVAVLATGSSSQATDIYALLHVVLALFGAARFGREVGLERAPARLTAVAYALSGPVLSLTCNPVYLAGAAWLPLALAWILRARRKAAEGGWPFARAVALAGAGLTPAFYGGDPQTAGWLALLAFVVFIAPAKGRASPVSRRFLGLLGLGGTALMLALPLLVAAALLVTETTRTSMSYATIGSWSLHPARLSELLIPFPLGLPFPDARYSVVGALEAHGDLWSHTLFLGAGIALFVLRGLGPMREEHRRARFALAAMAAVSLVLALGRYTPIHEWLCAYTPYGVFRYPEKHTTLLSLALAGLAGFGLQGWLESKPWQTRRRILPALLVPAGIVLLAFPLSRWAWSMAEPGSVAFRIPPRMDEQVFCVVLVQLWLLGLLAHPRLASARRAGLVVVGVALTSLSSQRQLVFDGPAERAERPPATVQTLRRLAPPRAMGQRVFRLPTITMFGGYPKSELEGVRGAEAAALMHPLTLGSATCGSFDLEGLHGMTGYWPLGLTKLRTVTSWEAYMERGAVGYVVGPLTPENAERSLFDQGIGIGIYHVPGRPRLEVLGDVHWAPTQEEAYAALAVVSTSVVVAVGPGSGSSESRAIGEVRPSAGMGEKNQGYLSLEVSAPSPALLVVRDAWFPGWEATLNGASVPIVHVDGAFMGVQVPAGGHHVELSYRTPGLRPSLLISLPAWGIVLFLLGGGALRRRAAGSSP